MTRTVKTIEWMGEWLRIIDQTRLPEEFTYLDLHSVSEVAEAIRSLRVRGAPAIGIAAAYGMVLAAKTLKATDRHSLLRELKAASDVLAATRPTAKNLFWALERMRATAVKVINSDPESTVRRLEDEAGLILEEDRRVCRAMGRCGAELLPQRCTVLTHCNAGALATADFGTALGVIYTAVDLGKEVRVFADETRPLLQGARLTAWELMQARIDVTLICDNAAAFVMQKGQVDAVLVGADRIAPNGDVANKVGTYNLAVLAWKHGVPMYVVAPLSTFDFEISAGADIPIEERDPLEVTEGFGKRTAPRGVKVYNPAFDVTPAELITAIVTEKGVIRPPFLESIAPLREATQAERSVH